jgi:hypothetical protein
LDRRSRIRSGSYLLIIPAFTRCSTHGVYFRQTAEWFFRENRLTRDCFPALGRFAGLSNVQSHICSRGRRRQRSWLCPTPRALFPPSSENAGPARHIANPKTTNAWEPGSPPDLLRCPRIDHRPAVGRQFSGS